MPKFNLASDTHRNPKSDRSNRGIEANYVNRANNAQNHVLHIDADGFVDGYYDKRGKLHMGELCVGGILNRHYASDYVQYEYDARLGVNRPVVMDGFNVTLRYCAEYWAKLQKAAQNA